MKPDEIEKDKYFLSIRLFNFNGLLGAYGYAKSNFASNNNILPRQLDLIFRPFISYFTSCA